MALDAKYFETQNGVQFCHLIFEHRFKNLYGLKSSTENNLLSAFLFTRTVAT